MSKKENKQIYQRIALLIRLIPVLFSIVLTGCGLFPAHIGLFFPHYLYTESVVTIQDSIKPPQVIKTESYREIKNNVNTVGIIAPDSCRKQSAMSSNRNQQDFIRSSCGVEIGIIEKKLVVEGFNVVSWKMLESMFREGKSYLQSGKELKIDILFSINSLENITADSSIIDLKRSYYKSDKGGTKGVPWPLEERHKKRIRKMLKEYEGTTTRPSFGATMDVTAIEVKTGKSIWFYQASFYGLGKQEKEVTAVFRGVQNLDGTQWRMVQLNGSPIRNQRQNKKKSSSDQETKRANISDDIFLRSLKIAVSSFISSFKSGM